VVEAAGGVRGDLETTRAHGRHSSQGRGDRQHQKAWHFVFTTAKRQNFAGAVSILDFYHGAERVHELAKAIDADEGAAKKRDGKWIKSLLKDKVHEVIEQARNELPRSPKKRKAATEQIKFLDAHQARMRYGT
jgi:hypothetical protein